MSKLKTIPFDPADYLDDDVAIATYLSEALAAGDAGHFQEALGTVARARGMGGVAEVSGLGRESLYKALRPGNSPTLRYRATCAVGTWGASDRAGR